MSGFLYLSEISKQKIPALEPKNSHVTKLHFHAAEKPHLNALQKCLKAVITEEGNIVQNHSQKGLL